MTRNALPLLDSLAIITVPALAADVDHVGVYYNPGHAGIPEPHYHFV
jgi:hypothetical protein